MNLWMRFYLCVTLFVTGAVVMILEILGTKVLGPFFGVTLYVWSALITVTLLSLSFGYWLGGLLADWKPKPGGLYSIICLTGLVSAFIPMAVPYVIHWVENMELRVGVLSSAFALFFFPLFGLGMVSPYAVRLLTRSVEKVGITSGTLYAVSTVGSFLGTLLAGFVLIPNVPVNQIFLIVSASLVVTAIAGLIFSGDVLSTLIWSLFLVVATGAILFFTRPRPVEASEFEILHQSESFYGQIKVVDSKGVRSLLVNGSPQNFVLRNARETLFDQVPYAVYLTALLLYQPEMKKVLMIGLGGGTLSKIFSKYGVDVDAIEIDTRMQGIAEKYFEYKQGNGKIFIGDGRYVMRHMTEKYDAIILDAYASYDAPFHLFTREMFEEAAKRLNPNGIFAINSAGSAEGAASRVTKSIYRTLGEVFKNVEAFHMEGTQKVDNIILFSSNGPLELKEQKSPLAFLDKKKLVMALSSNHFQKETLEGGIVITDNYNPIPYWGIPIYLAWREEVVRFFGKKVLEENG